VSQREPTGTKLGFQVRPSDTCAKSGQVADLVEAAQAVQATQVHGQHRGVAGQDIDVPHHAGAAAIGNQPRTDAGRIVNQPSHLRIGTGIGHPIRKSWNAPAPHGDPVGQALATGVADALSQVSVHQRVGRQARFGHRGHYFVQSGVVGWRG